nr:hypothetical protein [Tanacetum cinerariifolium]
MLDRTDFASWQQHIRLYCRGKEKERYNAHIRATNILLQWLPKDIYTLINHYTNAEDIWDNVKMLLEGSKLTKGDRESQLYDDFEHFRQNKGETIHDYYVWFAKLIIDMRNIKMNMSRMQLNSKFVNNMLPEWGRNVTVVKLNKGLRDSNFDQMYAYLKQHEAHANENKMMLDRFTQHTVDPLALMSNVSHPQVDIIEVKGTMHGVQVQLVTEELRTELGMQIQVKQGRLSVTTATENGVALDEEQLLFNVGGQDNVIDEDVYEVPSQDLALNVENVFQADDCNAFDSDVNEAPTAQTMFMANLLSADPVYDKDVPSYDSDILSEKENKYLEEFLDMKTLKEKIEDKLYKQDQSLQTVHMLCKPKFYYDEQNKDLLKMKEALKEQTIASRSFKALTEYRLNMPATLVPIVLSTKSQVKINIFALIQLFSDFEKTCKKRITPTGLTEGERGFEELEAEVDQNVVHKKHDKIERKNLLIANDNLIVDCLSKYVFYTATDFVLMLSRFSDMHEALNVAQKRIAELESENSNLQNKIQNDDHDVQSRGNTIRELREKISRLTKKHSDADLIHDFKALDSQNKALHAKVNDRCYALNGAKMATL